MHNVGGGGNKLNERKIEIFSLVVPDIQAAYLTLNV